jgi:hypothetical protein
MSIRSFALGLAASLATLPLAAAFAVTAKAETPRVAPPISHEAVSVYFLKGVSTPGPVPLTLAEALEKGGIEVHETGNVRELKIENKGAERVFVQMGDIVKGGRQDRVLTVSLELEPNSGMVSIGAYCVEQGRWAPRAGEDALKFATAEKLLPSREAKVAIARPTAPNVTGIESRRQHGIEREAQIQQQLIMGLGGARNDSQSEVWRSVDALQRTLSGNLATSVASERSRTSLQLSLENEKLAAAQAAYVAALEPAGLDGSEVVGVAIAIGGRVVSADLYPSNGLFRKMWPKIVRAAATEALALEDKPAGTAPGIEAVAAFLAAAESGGRSERHVGSMARLETRETASVLSVEASAPKGGLIHRSYLAK